MKENIIRKNIKKKVANVLEANLEANVSYVYHNEHSLSPCPSCFTLHSSKVSHNSKK